MSGSDVDFGSRANDIVNVALSIEKAMAPWVRMREERYDAELILFELGIFEPPIDVESVANKMGVVVRKMPIEHDGELNIIGTDAEIIVCASDHERRQRFTIAHELGHLMLHKLQKQYRDSHRFGSSSQIEREAHAFAAELLMPRSMVIAFAPRLGTVAKVSRAFNVSDESARIRIKQLFSWWPE